MLWKCFTQYASKFGKISSGHRTGKGQFWFQSQRKAMTKNVQTTVQLHSSQFSPVQLLSHVWLFVIPWTTSRQASLSITNSWSISHACKVMLKILQARLQQYVNQEFPDVQAGFRKGRRTRDQIANIHWIIEKAREFQKNIYFCFNDYTKAFDCVDHNKLWNILKEMGIPDHLTCLMRNLYAGQETIVRTRHGTMDWFQIGKGVLSRLYIVTLLI